MWCGWYVSTSWNNLNERIISVISSDISEFRNRWEICWYLPPVSQDARWGRQWRLLPSSTTQSLDSDFNVDLDMYLHVDVKVDYTYQTSFNIAGFKTWYTGTYIYIYVCHVIWIICNSLLSLKASNAGIVTPTNHHSSDLATYDCDQIHPDLPSYVDTQVFVGLLKKVRLYPSLCIYIYILYILYIFYTYYIYSIHIIYIYIIIVVPYAATGQPGIPGISAMAWEDMRSCKASRLWRMASSKPAPQLV